MTQNKHTIRYIISAATTHGYVISPPVYMVSTEEVDAPGRGIWLGEDNHYVYDKNSAKLFTLAELTEILEYRERNADILVHNNINIETVCPAA